MVTLVPIKVSGRFAEIVVLVAAIVRTMAVPMADEVARVCRMPLMGNGRAGMETGKDHRQEAEQGDKMTHAAFVSAMQPSWIVRVSKGAAVPECHHHARLPASGRGHRVGTSLGVNALEPHLRPPGRFPTCSPNFVRSSVTQPAAARRLQSP